ncbi:MAG TPA: hypothetical protein IAD08_07130 [Candidatus Scatovivens faecipullorum]|nr:hypothetical protein [Candidatus Scatovivens faecipullorum]
MKNIKISILILIVILSYLLLAFLPIVQNKSYAGDMVAGTLSPDIHLLDDSLYPGYKQLINNLQAKHPNYRFLLYYTGLDWNEALASEYQGHGSSPWNLVQVSDNYNGMWICPICGEKRYDNGSWCCASLEALAYMMDPRNSINESDIFQFKDLEGSDVSYNDIARVVSGYGSYLNNGEAIQAIVDASNQYNINGYYLVAKIINEHGKNGSTLSNGKGYNGQYVGVYNYFNIGSYGNGTATIINNGLSYALGQGWTSIRASIMGGAQVVKQKFIIQYSQNTLYYQKYNVSGKSALGSHQYQQNILAAQSQGSSLKSYYGSSTTASTYTFIIPLYKNMPKTASPRPNPGTKNSISYENGVIQNVSSSLIVRASPGGTAIGALNNGESVKILKRATTQVNGYYWDLIVSNKNGTYGYSARIVGGDQCIVGTGSGGTSSGSTGTNTNPPSQDTNTTPPPIDNTPNIETDIKLSGEKISTLPNINFTELKTKYKDKSLIVKNKEGKEITSGNLATGYTVTMDEKTYTIVKKGDVNGDGTSSVIDAVLMLNAVKGTTKLEGVYKEAALIKNNSTFNVTDVVSLLNYIKGTSKLSL